MAKSLQGARARAVRARYLHVESLEPRWCMALAVPALSSLAGANHTIYLDFDGHVTEGTYWNSYFNNSSIRSPAYTTDGDASSFSSAELADIQQAWQRIAEDFLPFAVNVTTIDPGVEALRRMGGGDTQWGIRVVVTADTERSGAGGIAYIDSFNWSSDTPAFVYTTSGKYIAEAASHEAGHTLGLAHDGRGGSEYYYGHGSGATSWAPLMGVGYDAAVTQWDQGEYSGTTNGGSGANYGKGPSDLIVITTYNGFGYRADDHGNAIIDATPLTSAGGAVSGAGIIGSAQDADVFALVTGAGSITLTVSPAALGANLDVRADLLDAAGNLIASSNPVGGLDASLSVGVAAGTYYLRIDGVGVGNPAANPPTGYSDYGSIGQYTIAGQIIDAGGFVTLAVGDVSVSESAGEAVFTVTLSGTISEAITVEFATSDGTAQAGSDYVLAQGLLTFLPGGPTQQQQIVVPIVGDSAYEAVEQFFVRLQNATGGVLISDAQGTGTISDDDFALSIGSASVREGSPNRGKKTTEVQLTPITFTVNLSAPSATAVTVQYATQDGTAIAGSDYNAAVGTITFAPGETAKSLNVYAIADSLVELDEGFRVVLSAPVGAELATAIGAGTIVDDDSKGGGKPPRISATRYTTAALAPKARAPKPVRDVFAWQGGADHRHDQDVRETDWHEPDYRGVMALVPLAAGQLHEPTAPATTWLTAPRILAGFVSVNERRYWTESTAAAQTGQPWPADEWEAGNDLDKNRSSDLEAGAEADWLDALACDQAALSAA